jgi:hypothetical protein
MARNSPQFFVLIASAASSPRTSATSLTCDNAKSAGGRHTKSALLLLNYSSSDEHLVMYR